VCGTTISQWQRVPEFLEFSVRKGLLKQGKLTGKDFAGKMAEVKSE